ncbi:non-ribosomal peptide synthetase, partial [Phytohabitans kaempferiae]
AGVSQGAGLFDSIVVFENYPVDTHAAAAHGLRLGEVESSEVGTYPLNLIAYTGDELTGELRYDPALFDAATVERMAVHLGVILDAMAADPERPVSALPVLTEAEHHQIVVEWNDTAAPYPSDLCVHEVFEAQARCTPEAVALRFEGASLTYAELDARANQLAHHLRGLGVGPEDRVGLAMERSADLIIAMLGVLKAGAAYVPLDPGYPAERLTFMVEDVAAPVILTVSGIADRLPPTPARTVLLDRDWPVVGQLPTTSPGVGVGPDSPVYVMYTSGSTGRPRGAIVRHRGVVRLVKPIDYCKTDGDEVVAQSASISFDASTFEIWSCLLNGARLAIYPPGETSLRRLADFVAAESVTTLVLATGMFHEIVDADVEMLAGLRQIVVGGDVLSPVHCARVTDRAPDLQIINVYGPTECTSISTVHLVSDNPSPDRRLPIGPPIANTRVYVLDEERRVVPVGVRGEVYIGGDGVGLGYLNRPELNAERFLPDPFVPSTERPAPLLYKTGDLARWLPDGQLDFQGRVDTQVKIRGFRIEPGEVEAALVRHPAVAEAAVVVHGEGATRRLVGYVVPESGGTVDVVELRAFVGRAVPEYMVPPVLMVLERLPLTPNGKVDRRALPAPEARAVVGAEFAAPSSETEQVLANLWVDVLGVDRVGVRDSFFELGGDSILSIRVVARVREVFGVDLSPRELFNHPTIAELAETIEDKILAEIERELSEKDNGTASTEG